ncbi:MAG: hypothetical protein ABI844_03570 [Saprospiraceae bacterium]
MQLQFIIFGLCSLLFGKNPVSWTTTSEKLGTNEYKLVFTATIEDGWNIYSQYLKGDDGPVKTSFTYENESNIELIGNNEETGDIRKIKDEMFGMELIKIKHKGVFTQIIKIKDINKPVTGAIEFMCCNEVQCLPPKSIPFSINLSTAK